MEDCRAVVEEALEKCLRKNITDWGKIKTTIKDSLSEFLWKRTKRSPMILPIKEAEFYRNYLACRERLYEHPDLLRGLNEFKKRNSEIQNRGSVDNPYDEVVALFEEYDAIVHDTIVNDFLRAERKLCRMLKTMYDEIADGLDVDIKQ